MSGPTLYQLNEHLRAIFDASYESGGELTPELEQQLAINEAEFEVKAESYCHAIRILSGQADMFKAEQDRIAAGRKAIERNIERLERRLSEAVLLRGGKADIGTFRLSHRKSESVQIENADALPSEFVEYIETAKPKKDEIKAALKAGQQVPGAFIEVRQNLQIK